MTKNKEESIIFAIGECPGWLSEAICKELTRYVGKKVESGGYCGRDTFEVYGTKEDAEICRAWLQPSHGRLSLSLADVYDDEMRQNIGTWRDKWDHEWRNYVIYDKISEYEYIVHDNTMRDKYNFNISKCYIGLTNDSSEKHCQIMFCEEVERAGMTDNGRPLLKMKLRSGMYAYDLLREHEKKTGVSKY